MLDRHHFEELDRIDPLAEVAARFSLPAGVTYLDGNSLGPLPTHVAGAVDDVVRRQWGRDLIRSWNDNGWWDLAGRVGDRIAAIIGAPLGTVVVGDSTTVGLYKTVAAACALQPDRRVLLTDTGNFPTDLYALDSVAGQLGAEVWAVDPGDVVAAIDQRVAVVVLTHVDYRTGRRHDLAATTAAAHAAGALIVWDLSHSAGAMDLDLADADMAVGCGYKYLNGGPGAPSYTYVNARHLAEFANPIQGWWGHLDPFAMEARFRPATGRARIQIGTQPIISMAALDAALDIFEAVEPLELRRKSELLTGGFIALADQMLDGFEVATPRSAAARGSHVSLANPDAGAIMPTLIAMGVIGDVRPPDLLRFGLAPTFQRHVDVWEAVSTLKRVMDEELWRDAPGLSGPVT